MRKDEKERRQSLKKRYLQSDPAYSAKKVREEKNSLSAEDIQVAVLSGNDLEELVVQVVQNLIGNDFGKEEKVLATLPDVIRYIYATWLLEADVMNGGLEQFFFNQRPQILQQALDGYSYYGLSNCNLALEEALKKLYFNTSDFDKEDRIFDAEWLNSKQVKNKHISENPDAYLIG